MYLAMFRSALAILLVLCWMLLSGFDVLADLNLAKAGKFIVSAEGSNANKHFTALLGSDILESAAYHSRRSLNDRERSTVGIALFAAEFPQKITKLHKLLRVFII